MVKLLLILSIFLSCNKSENGIDKTENAIITNDKPLIYLVDYVREDGNLIISWKFNARFREFKTVHLKTTKGEELVSVDYPTDYCLLNGSFYDKNILLQIENKKGQFSEDINLNLDRDNEYEALTEKNHVKRVVINKEAAMPYFHKEGDSAPLQLFGTNYVRLRGLGEDRTKQHDHSTFEAVTDLTNADYNPYHVETLFRIMKARGFNFVRVFVIGRSPNNPGISGSVSLNEPVYRPYMDNFIDFLERARKYGIYVYPAFGDGGLPKNEWYKKRLSPEFQNKLNEMSQFLPFVKEAVDLKAEYITAFLNYIKAYDETLIQSLLAVQLQNEYCLYSNQWPFTQQTGVFEAFWGEEYDMTDARARQNLADDATIFYQNKMVEAVDKIDSELLVCESFFSLDIVGKTPENSVGLFPYAFEDKRYPPLLNVTIQSNIDFIDIHEYPVKLNTSMRELFDIDMNSLMDNSTNLNDLLSKKPILLGEFGGFYEFENDLESAAVRMVELADIAMESGFSGWCYWTFDTFEQRRLYNMLEENEEILDALSPLGK